MKLVEFPEQTQIVAKNQPEYIPMPVYRYPSDKMGHVVCCWQMTWAERLQILLTGKIWQSIRTFNKPIQPQLIQVDKPKMQ